MEMVACILQDSPGRGEGGGDRGVRETVSQHGSVIGLEPEGERLVQAVGSLGPRQAFVGGHAPRDPAQEFVALGADRAVGFADEGAEVVPGGLAHLRSGGTAAARATVHLVGGRVLLRGRPRDFSSKALVRVGGGGDDREVDGGARANTLTTY